jgi:hypothetical protein
VVYINNGVEYYLAIKNNKILSFVGKLVELKIIMLSKAGSERQGSLLSFVEDRSKS